MSENIICPVCGTANSYDDDYCIECDFILEYEKNNYKDQIDEDELLEYKYYINLAKEEYAISNLNIEPEIPENYEIKKENETNNDYNERHLAYGYVPIDTFVIDIHHYDLSSRKLNINTSKDDHKFYLIADPSEASEIIQSSSDNIVYQKFIRIDENIGKVYCIILNDTPYLLEETTVIEHNGFEYKTVTSPFTGKIWLDRNLGALKIPEKIDEEESFGDYYQWGRGADGHENKNSKITTTLSNLDIPDHGDFIQSDYKHGFDWKVEPNDNLWKKKINNPCPEGFRLPTQEEFTQEIKSARIKNNKDAFESFLKLPSAGYRCHYDDIIKNHDKWCCLWTNDTIKRDAVMIHLYDQGVHSSAFGRTGGLPIRCIKEE